jgi:hypothetical protein
VYTTGRELLIMLLLLLLLQLLVQTVQLYSRKLHPGSTISRSRTLL